MVYHISNAFLEWELANSHPTALEEAFSKHPVFSQLQFLPLLYADPLDCILLSQLPSPEFLSTHPLSLSPFSLFSELLDPQIPLESWAPSMIIAKWAEAHHLSYEIPSMNLTKKIHSKEFAFGCATPLPGAELIDTEEKLSRWITSFPGKKVLKAPLLAAGRGHFFLDDKIDLEKMRSFVYKEWSQNRSVIGEPWVTRLCDFSTQWKIEKGGQIHFLGSTICVNSLRGQYSYTITGDEKKIFGSFFPFLQTQLAIAHPLVSKISALGWFGNLGIDAFVYEEQEPTLHPIVEINARKTMGYAALLIQKRHFPNQIIQVSYPPMKQGLLPSLSRKNIRIDCL